MAPVIELCRTCGFDIPTGTDDCPTCGVPAPPPLAARQVAGLALPTRSVHPVPHLRPRPEVVADDPIGPATAARSAFSFTTVLAMVTVAAAGLHWLAGQPRFVLQVPDGTAALLAEITRTAAVASVAALLVGLAAMAAWGLRATGHAVHRALHERIH